MNIGDILLKLGDFLGDFSDWLNSIVNWQFSVGGLTVTFWDVIFAVGIGSLIFAIIIKVII